MAACKGIGQERTAGENLNPPCRSQPSARWRGDSAWRRSRRQYFRNRSAGLFAASNCNYAAAKTINTGRGEHTAVAVAAGSLSFSDGCGLRWRRRKMICCARYDYKWRIDPAECCSSILVLPRLPLPSGPSLPRASGGPLQTRGLSCYCAAGTPWPGGGWAACWSGRDEPEEEREGD